MCIFVIILFKQTTAYEMRISDWSSDVCSSDLGSTFSREPRGRPAADRSELATRAPKASPVHLVERGRDGVFDWVDEDLSARVAADPEQGLHVPPVDKPDGRQDRKSVV